MIEFCLRKNLDLQDIVLLLFSFFSSSVTFLLEDNIILTP